MDKKILLMFLGGTPTSPNIINHWKMLNTEFANKDNYYIVIHPLILEENIINIEFKNIFKEENIFIVSKEYHLSTEWATRSLSDATLLMAEYAHLYTENLLYDKYILLSANCCPLYTLDEIFNVITSNNKSWLFTNDYIRLSDSTLYEKPTETVYTTNFDRFFFNRYNFSQWMILDKIHMRFFFPHDTPIYKKKIEETMCNNYINSIRLIDRSHCTCRELYFYLKSYDECDLSDEMFFGTFIIYKLVNQKIKDIQLSALDKLAILKDNIENISEEDIKYNLQHIPKIILDEMSRINTVNQSKINFVNQLYKFPSKKQFGLNGVLNDAPTEFKNKIYLQKSEDEEDDAIDKFYFKMSTYTNWNYTSVNPFNILRGIPFDINKTEYLNSLEIFDFTKLKIIDIRKYSLPKSHPNEYSIWTFRNILNLYYLLRYCITNSHTKNFDKYFDIDIYKSYLIYHKIICKKLYISNGFSEESLLNNDIRVLLDESKEVPIDIIEDMITRYSINLDEQYGSTITDSVLISALSMGSLFIRKCTDTSLIETFTTVLKQCKYIFLSEPLREITEIDTLTPFNLSIYKKYLKYKLKYINLKNAEVLGRASLSLNVS
jgi:hypothetical protein